MSKEFPEAPRTYSKEPRSYTFSEVAGLYQDKKAIKDVTEAALKFNVPQSQSPESTPDLQPFLLDTFKRWYTDEDAKKNPKKLEQASKQPPESISPKDIDWEVRKQDNDTSKFGQHTLNPDTANLDFESIPKNKIHIEALPDDMNGKPLAEIGKYVVDTYSGKYHIPGIEYFKYILENPDKAPQNLKEGNWNFFFGSILRDRHGRWSVPYAEWLDSVWARDAYWLVLDWHAGCRVVLIEK